MKTIGIQEALTFNPQGDGPRVSIYWSPKQLSPNIEKIHQMQKLNACQASVFIRKSYGAAFASQAEEDILKSLRLGTQTMQSHRSGLAFLWSQSDFCFVKIPSPIETTLVVSDTFHVKSLMAAQSSRGDFLLMYRTGISIEIVKVQSAKIAHIASISLGSNPLLEINRQRIMSQMRDTVGQVVLKCQLPILVSGNDTVMSLVAREFTDAESVLNCLVIHKNMILGKNSIFAAARQIMDPYFFEKQRHTAARLNRLNARRILGADRVTEALMKKKALEVFLAEDVALWGRFDSKKGCIAEQKTQRDAHDGDVLNDIALLARRLSVPVHILPRRHFPSTFRAVALLSDSSAPFESSDRAISLASA